MITGRHSGGHQWEIAEERNARKQLGPTFVRDETKRPRARFGEEESRGGERQIDRVEKLRCGRGGGVGGELQLRTAALGGNLNPSNTVGAFSAGSTHAHARTTRESSTTRKQRARPQVAFEKPNSKYI